jgi:hypothetical protein
MGEYGATQFQPMIKEGVFVCTIDRAAAEESQLPITQLKPGSKESGV